MEPFKTMLQWCECFASSSPEPVELRFGPASCCGVEHRRPDVLRHASWSAVVAILFEEEDHLRYSEAIEGATSRLVSAVTRVELSFVIEGRKGEAGRERLERFFALTGAEVIAVTPQQATIAISAFRNYGKDRHTAGLNVGDCFSYALASATGHPLLFKGDDFARTDIRSVLT